MSQVKMCGNCKFFGRRTYLDRQPTGQCCKNEPDSYEVLQRKEGPERYGSAVVVVKLVVIESPWPGVWPGDVCGEWQPKEDAN